MKEEVEFRIPEENAVLHLPRKAGVSLGGSVRKLVVSTDDPLFARIGELQRQYNAKADFFFLGREVRRTYTREELERASLFHIWPKKVFEPAGEECGTVYDDSGACPECGAGGKQVSELTLDLRKAPKSVDFAATIAGEQIVSQRFAECLVDAKISGVTLKVVNHKARYEDDPVDLSRVPSGRELLRNAEAAGAPHSHWTFWVWLNQPANRALLEKATAEFADQKRTRVQKRGATLPVWYQLIVNARSAELSPRTRFGSDPFDTERYGCCSRGDLAGLNRLSEISVERKSLPNVDMMLTRQMVGVRRGLLRPEPMLLVSPKAREAITGRTRGVCMEVVHCTEE